MEHRHAFLVGFERAAIQVVFEDEPARVIDDRSRDQLMVKVKQTLDLTERQVGQIRRTDEHRMNIGKCSYTRLEEHYASAQIRADPRGEC